MSTYRDNFKLYVTKLITGHGPGSVGDMRQCPAHSLYAGHVLQMRPEQLIQLHVTQPGSYHRRIMAIALTVVWCVIIVFVASYHIAYKTIFLFILCMRNVRHYQSLSNDYNKNIIVILNISQSDIQIGKSNLCISWKR